MKHLLLLGILSPFLLSATTIERRAVIVCMEKTPLIANKCSEIKKILSDPKCNIDPKNLHLIEYKARTSEKLTEELVALELNQYSHIPVFLVGHGTTDKKNGKHFIGMDGEKTIETDQIVNSIRKGMHDPSLFLSACYAGGCQPGGCFGTSCNSKQLTGQNLDELIDLPTAAIAKMVCKKELYKENVLPTSRIKEEICDEFFPFLAVFTAKDKDSSKKEILKKFKSGSTIQGVVETKTGYKGYVFKPSEPKGFPFEVRILRDGTHLIHVFNPYPGNVFGEEEFESKDAAMEKLGKLAKGSANIEIKSDKDGVTYGYLRPDEKKPRFPFELIEIPGGKFLVTILDNDRKPCIQRFIEIQKGETSLALENPMDLQLDKFNLYWTPERAPDDFKKASLEPAHPPKKP